MASAMASASPNKQALKKELLDLLEGALSSLEHAHAASNEGATHEEAKPENDKDTRALEQSYLARGQARRVEELRAGVGRVREMPVRAFGPDDPIALGAVVTVLEAETQRVVFIAPEGGGTTLSDGEVLVVTPRAPFGRALLGKRCGDVCEYPAAGRTRELEVIGVD